MKSLRKHFSSGYNLNDCIWLTVTPTVIVCSMADETWIEMSSLRVMAAFSSFSLLFKTFDWMRLFDGTSFYILLIKETLMDIKDFSLLFAMSLMMFGAPLIMLSFNSSDANNEVLVQNSSFWLFDVLIN